MKKTWKKSPVSWVLLSICVVVYGYTRLRFGTNMNAYEALQVGGLLPPLITQEKEWYRLLTANFIHFDFLHILCNCYSLYVIAMQLQFEALLQTKRYLFIIITSMLFTTGIPCLLYVIFGIGGQTVMGGISGVIFGLIGAMLLLAMYFKGAYLRIFKLIYPSVLLTLVLPIFVPSISWIGHISGMIGGFISMLLIVICKPLSIWK